MKIMFLHLSDLHIKDNGGYNSFQLDKVIDAALSAGSVDHVLVLITGDLAFSGKKYEYRQVNKCVKHIVNGYKDKAHLDDYIKVFCVPGNHDISFPDDPGEQMTSQKLQGIRKLNSYEKHLSSQLSLQHDFFEYAYFETSSRWKHDHQFSRSIIEFENYRIELNMFNSGIFSSLDEDKGLHYLSQKALNDFTKPSGADFVISMIHHAPEWYTDDIKHQFEDVLYGKSSIVFMGHEHYIEQKTITHENMSLSILQAGGCLCNNDNWQNSSFFIGILDTSDYQYEQIEFTWNSHQKQYEQAAQHTMKLAPKPSVETKLHMKEDFLHDFLQDPKHNHLTDDFRKYFVFPRIQQQSSEGVIEQEIVNEEDFISEILQKKRILIYGGYNLGKSTLLKSLFMYFSKDFTPVFCNVANIHGTNTERMIRNSFEDCYGDNDSDYIRFKQLPKEKRVVIIDDADQISSDSFEPFVHFLAESFELIIIASKQVLDFNLVERTKAIFNTDLSLSKYTIMPLYSDKRHDLIRKVVDLKTPDKTVVDKTTKLLSDSITSQRRSIILDPDFIINYVEYYCNNIGELTNSDSSVFSKVFEANISTSLSLYCKGALSVNKIFTILGKVAYFIHFRKAYPLNRDDLIKVIEEYNADYGDDVSVKNVISIIIKSKLMIEEESQSGKISYRFSSRNYLAYFIAREVNAAYNSTHDSSDLQSILRCACFGINADILLFISYITDNIQILNTLLEMAKALIAPWEEFDYTSEQMPKYLSATSFAEIAPPQPGEYEREQKAALESEKAEYTSLRVANIYDYTDEEAEETANQIIRACSLLVVIAKCLPGFEHNMKKEEKEAFVDMIYRMPNRIFGRWASLTDQVVGDIIEFFQSQGQDYYHRNIPKSKDDILFALQNASISVLLDLYNMASYYSTRESTYKYLSGYNYKVKPSFSVQHLMMLEKARQTTNFTDEAIRLVDSSEVAALKISVAYVVRHAIVFTPELLPQQLDRLSERFFSKRETKARLMAQRYLRPSSTKKE